MMILNSILFLFFLSPLFLFNYIIRTNSMPLSRINHPYPFLMFRPFKYLWAVMFLYCCLPTLGHLEALHFFLSQALHSLHHSLGCSLDHLQFAYIISVLRCQKYVCFNWSLIGFAFTQIMYTKKMWSPRDEKLKEGSKGKLGYIEMLLKCYRKILNH